MTDHGIERFLRALGAEEPFEKSREWINCKCPLAPWTHGSGVDTRPSFGISINNDGPSVYYCFGCSPQGQRLPRILHTMWLGEGVYPEEAAEIFAEYEFHDAQKAGRLHVPDVWESEVSKPDPLPPQVIRRFPLLTTGTDYIASACRSYLESERHIPRWVYAACRVRYSPEYEALVFPLTDIYGVIHVIRFRSIHKKEMWTLSAQMAGLPEEGFPKISTTGVWFGMELADWTRPVMIVEGEIDAMRLMALGYFNVVASATSMVAKKQLQNLTAPQLILGFDRDLAGQKATQRVINIASDRFWLNKVDWGASDCKDAGALKTKEQLAQVIDAMEIIG